MRPCTKSLINGASWTSVSTAHNIGKLLTFLLGKQSPQLFYWGDKELGKTSLWPNCVGKPIENTDNTENAGVNNIFLYCIEQDGNWTHPIPCTAIHIAVLYVVDSQRITPTQQKGNSGMRFPFKEVKWEGERHIYYTTHKISSANMGFGNANIQRYYTGQQLIAQLWSVRGETSGRINGGKLIISLNVFCCIINNLLQR